jgi:hypothetical protein
MNKVSKSKGTSLAAKRNINYIPPPTTHPHTNTTTIYIYQEEIYG